MLPESARLFSADDHIIEPPDVWTSRVPAAFRDRCPRIVSDEHGVDAWLYDGELVHTYAGSTRVLPGSQPGIHVSYRDMRPGCYEPKARLVDMDEDGVFGQLLFPNYARFAGHRFLESKDLEVGALCLRAYNDFAIDEFAAADPDRLKAIGLLPMWDIDASVAEVQRIASRGVRAVAFSENPTVLGLPSVHTDHWDPLFAAVEEAGLLLCMHIGSSSQLLTTSKDAPPVVQVALLGVNSMMAGVDWFFSGILDRFPRLRIVLSEGGAGWLPWLLERADKCFYDERIGKPSGKLRASRPPSEVVGAGQVFACMVAEKACVDMLGILPVSCLLWESDYPHGDGLWPDNRRWLVDAFADVPEADAVAIAGGNLAAALGIELYPDRAASTS